MSTTRTVKGALFQRTIGADRGPARRRRSSHAELIHIPTVNPAYRPCAERIGTRLATRGFNVSSALDVSIYYDYTDQQVQSAISSGFVPANPVLHGLTGQNRQIRSVESDFAPHVQPVASG